MDAELYHGREQTYAKHLFLEQYLERVAFHIAYAHDEFVYVDGFSGPWKAIDEGLEDTSFMIAIRKLQCARLSERSGKPRACAASSLKPTAPALSRSNKPRAM
jgi:hypothetical protein